TIFARDWSSDVCSSDLLKKEHGFIDWRMAAVEIHNRVRAFNPWPGTAAKFRGVVCKILKTSVGVACEGLNELGGGPSPPGSPERSEERRVGKQGRYRGG